MLDKLLGIFGKKRPPNARVSFSEARQIVQDELRRSDQEFLSFSSKKFAEVKHLLGGLSKKADVLASQKINVKEGNEAYRKMVVTSQKNLARQLKGLSAKLKPPNVVSPETVRDYSSKSMASISNDLLPYWKNIALTKLLLKNEVKEIGQNLKELSEALEELNKRAFSDRPQKLAALKKTIDSLAEKESKVDAVQHEFADSKKLVSVAEQEVSSIKKTIEEKKTSKDALRLKELEQKKSEMEAKKLEIVSSFNSLLAPLEKVLKRLDSVADSSGALSAREKEVLKLLLEKPEAAIISDAGGDATKSLLTKADFMIRSGSISIKDSEKDKRVEAIKAALAKDFFTEYFWKLNKIEADFGPLAKQISSFTVSSELKSIEAKMVQAQSLLDEKKRSQEKIGKELAAMQKEVSGVEGAIVPDFNALFNGTYVLAAAPAKQ